MTTASFQVDSPDSSHSRTGGTSSEQRGIRVTPRLPDLEFGEELRPRWVNDDAALTSFWAALGVIAPVAETWFIRSGKSLLPRIDNPAIADETRRFLQQEAYHARVHERLNGLLEQRGHPVAPIRRYVTDLLNKMQECGGEYIAIAGALAGEQAIGEIGDAIVKNPWLLDDCDPAPRAMIFWHAFEEVEHSAALYDAYENVYGRGWRAYLGRLLGLTYAVSLLAMALPAATHAMLAHAEPGQNRRRHWRRIFGHLFGPSGLLRSSGPVVAAYLRRDFHPWKLRDAGTVLMERRSEFVRDEWIV